VIIYSKPDLKRNYLVTEKVIIDGLENSMTHVLVHLQILDGQTQNISRSSQSPEILIGNRWQLLRAITNFTLAHSITIPMILVC
jgi:hypothetical protein